MISEERKSGKEIPGFVYAGIWLIFGVSMSYGNKIVFNYTDFKYPVLLSTLHMVVNSVFVYVCVNFTKLVPEEKKHLGADEKKAIRYFVLIFCFNIAFGNISIRIVDLALSQMLRATMPVFSLTLSYIVLKHTTSIYVVLTLIPIIVGVAMMSITNVQFSFFNAFIIFIGVILCAAKGVQAHVTLKQYQIHPFVLLMHLAPLSSIVMFILSIVFLEVTHLYNNFGQVFGYPNVAKNTMIPLLTAMIAFVLNILSFLANRGTSPLTMAVLGNIKQATVIFTSIYIFKSQVSLLGMFGILMAVLGMFLYTFARYHHSKKKKISNSSTTDLELETENNDNNQEDNNNNNEENNVWEVISDNDDNDKVVVVEEEKEEDNEELNDITTPTHQINEDVVNDEDEIVKPDNTQYV